MNRPTRWSLGAAISGLALLGVVGVLDLTGEPLPAGGPPDPEAEQARHQERRRRMVTDQIEARGIKDRAVLEAMRAVPRHRFVPEPIRDHAYDDGPLPIGEDQTISQPYVVALMTSLIRPNRSMRVLEVGTGSGYQAAVLAECVGEVDTIEVIPSLGKHAGVLLRELGYDSIRTRIGDGYDGWPERAPYDAILLTAAPPRIPAPLVDQLAEGGRLVAPVGRGVQELVVLTKARGGIRREVVDAVQFVPMTGKAEADR